LDHHGSVKHLLSCLDEVAFKYRNRDNTNIFRDTSTRWSRLAR
jgi:hypothetical protein